VLRKIGRIIRFAASSTSNLKVTVAVTLMCIAGFRPVGGSVRR
jgi:hypothetical protein